MKIFIDTKSACYGDMSDLIIVEIDDMDRQFLNQATKEERLDWLDEVMEQPTEVRDSYYLTAMLPI